MTETETAHTRRSVLGGIGGTSIGLLGTASAADPADTVTITTVKAGDTPVVTKQVPASWYRHELRARDARSNLLDRWNDNPGVTGVGIGTSKDRIEGRKASTVDVYVDPDGADISVPSNVGGVETTVQETIRVEPSTCNTGNFDIMPGGVVNEEDDGNSGGTATCEVSRTVNGTKKYYMMTSAHLFTCSGSDIDGDRVNQSGRYFGTIADHNFDQDWAIVERDPDGAVDDFDNEIEDTAGILSGHVTEDGLADLKSNDTTVYKQGITTCKESGQVDRYNASVTASCNNISSSEYVVLTTYEDNGDSGAPHYHQYTYNGCYYLAIIAPHLGGTCSSSPCYGSAGCAAYHINSDHGISFDPEFEFGYCK